MVEGARSTSSRVGFVTLLLLMQLFTLRLAWAQADSSLLVGVVHDIADLPVQNARVFLIQDSTKSKRQAWTGPEGEFAFPRLEPGRYTLQAFQEGFALTQIPKIVLLPGETRSLQIRFKIGTARQTISVHAGDFDEASVITTRLNRDLVDDIPLNGRSLQPLLLLTPGVVMMANNEFSFNGQATNMNYFTVDDVSVNLAVSGGGASTDLGQDAGYSALGTTSNLISVDALDELTVRSSTISPQIGRQPGGHVQLSSRSGNDELHGGLFEFFRDSALDASDWFAPAGGTPNTKMRQNVFGGTLAGPIPWPSLHHHHFTFFLSEESLRLRQPTALITYVPSRSVRNAAPKALLPFLNVFPISKAPEISGTGTSAYRLAISNPSSEDNFSVRIDSNHARKLSFFTRVNNSHSSRVSTDSGWYLSSTERRSMSVTAGGLWRITPRLLNDLRINYSDNTGDLTNKLHGLKGATIPQEKVLLQGISRKVKSPSLTYSFLGSTYSLKSTGQNPIHQINLTDNTMVDHGKHIWGYGFDVLRLVGATVPSDFDLSVNFLSQASITSGIADSVGIRSQDAVRVIQTNASIYGQDTWKLNGRITLDYGMRWEVSPAPAASDGRGLYTVTSTRDIPNMTLAPAGTRIYPTIYTNLAPRVGLSWLIANRPGAESVIHLGAGVFYSLGNTNSMASANTFPHVRQVTLYNRPYPSKTLLPLPDSNVLSPPYQGQTFYAFADGYSTPAVYQLSFGLEQQLGNDRKMSVAYVGSQAQHLFVVQQLIDPNKNFTRNTSISEVRNEGVSTYDSLQMQYNQRISYGIRILASYTWAHSIDNASSDINGFPWKKLIPLTGERGSSDYDLRHNLGMAVSYETHALKANGVAGRLLNHWNMGALFMARGGMPLDVTYSRPIGAQLFSARPDRIQGKRIYLKQRHLPEGTVLNYKAFSVPSSPRQGELERNFLRSRPAWQADLSIHRSFSLPEKLLFEGRAEFFNVFNHPNFGTPDTNLGTYSEGTLARNPAFGHITKMLNTQLGGLQQSYQVGGPRSIQLSLRLAF